MMPAFASSRVVAAVFLSGLLGAAAGCNGQVVSEADGGGGSGGSTATSSSSTSSATGTGGSGDAPVECVVQPEGTGGFQEPTCADLSVLAVSNPTITDDPAEGAIGNANGQVEPGETATLRVDLSEIAGVGFNMYPGVTFTTSDVGVTVTANDWLYAIFACQVQSLAGSVAIAADVPPGTVVTIHAAVAMINSDCPDAPGIDIPITVH